MNHDAAPNPPVDGELLLSRYLDGELDAAELDQLQQWLRADPTHISLMVDRTIDHHRTAELARAGAAAAVAELTEDDLSADDPTDGSSAMNFVIDQALAERRKHDLEDEANRQLAAQQREYARNRRFEMRGHATSEPAKHVLVIPQAAAWIGFAAMVGLIMWVAWPSTAPVNKDSTNLTAQTDTPQREADIAEERGVVVAQIIDSVDARWQGEADPGPLMTGTTLALESGFAEISFDDRGVVLVEGPAVVEVVEEGTLRLVSGRVVARSTHTTVPLTMLVDNTAIRGVQAEFGVSCDSRTQATSLVYAGSIDVATILPTAQASAVVLAEGRIATLSTQRGTIGSQTEATSLQAASYSRSIDGARGRPAQLTETVRYLVDAPNELFLGELVSSEHVWLFCEVRGVHIDETIARAFRDIRPTLGVFYPGQVMDSYLLHLDPVGDVEGSSPTAIEGSVTFDRPIHAVIGDARTLRATDILFGVRGLAYPRDANTAGGVPGAKAWGIELTSGDVLTLSRDGRTLHFRIQASSSLDQVRILVACEGSD